MGVVLFAAFSGLEDKASCDKAVGEQTLIERLEKHLRDGRAEDDEVRVLDVNGHGIKSFLFLFFFAFDEFSTAHSLASDGVGT